MSKEEIKKEVEEVFNKHGVCNWVYGFDDPDSDVSCQRNSGSLHWGLGISMDCVEVFKTLLKKTEKIEPVGE